MNENVLALEKMNSLYDQIRVLLKEARSSAYRAVNLAMVRAYWQIGFLIVEYEQRGQSRAEYGMAVLEELSKRLTIEFGNGYSVQNLRYMRQFYLSFRKRHAVRGESQASDKKKASRSKSLEKRHLMGGELYSGILRPELSWTHYRLLLRVENEKAREWYMNEAADQSWSTRQ
jgi:predicted nuclease of restriction endonuclease-like (RecB) superfamily